MDISSVVELFVVYKDVSFWKSGLWWLKKFVVQIDLVVAQDIFYFLLTVELMDAAGRRVGLR